MTPTPPLRSIARDRRVNDHPLRWLYATLTLLLWAATLPGVSRIAAAQELSSPRADSNLTPPPPRRMQAADNAYLDGARLLERDQLAAAEQQFIKAVELDPTNPQYPLALGVVREHRIAELVQQASRARLLGRPAAADTLLAQALALDPENVIVKQHMAAQAIAAQPMAAQHLLATGGPMAAQPTPSSFKSTLVDTLPDLSADTSSIGKTGVAYAGLTVLAPTQTPQSFHLRSDVQQVITRVATAFGIRAVLDTSVTPEGLRFDLDDTSYAQAMPILLDMGRLFAVPLDAHSVLIAKDTPDNRQRLERQFQETVYVPALTTEQLNELATILRNVFDLKQVTVQPGSGTLAVRGPSYLLDAMNLTLADLVDGGAEVLIDLKLYALDRARTRNIGTQLPQQFGIYNVEGAATSLVNANQTLVDQAIAQGLVPPGSSNITIALALIASGLVQSALLTNTIGFFGGGLTATGVTTNASPSFSLALNSSDTRVLDDIQLRVGDRQSGTFRVGTRYPITTSTYSFQSFGANSAALNGITINGVSAASLLSQFLGSGSSTTIPQIQYEDLGITLKTTPIVQKSNNVTVHVDLKIEALAGGSINNIPILASRQFVSDVTVADGQTALLVSGVSKTEASAVAGLPGLGELPGFQTATADRTAELDSSDLVLLITPHIVRHRSSVIAGPRIALNLPAGQD